MFIGFGYFLGDINIESGSLYNHCPQLSFKSIKHNKCQDHICQIGRNWPKWPKTADWPYLRNGAEFHFGFWIKFLAKVKADTFSNEQNEKN